MGAADDPLLRRHLLTADDYQRLGAAGVLAPDARVELIEGEVIDMAPIGTRHWAMVNRLAKLLEAAAGQHALVSAQSSLRLGTMSEPQPDVALYRPRDDFYCTALPTAADTLLLIEVADSTLRYDREIKLPLYARNGIVEVWLVDVEGRLLTRHADPQGERYARVAGSADPGVMPIEALAGVTVDLTGLFG